eukprot:423371_1
MNSLDSIRKQISISDQFLNHNEDQFIAFNSSIRNQANCITNYAIQRSHINTSFLKSKTQFIKSKAQLLRGEYDSDDYPQSDVYYVDYKRVNTERDRSNLAYLIRLDHINLLNAFHDLKCPFCNIRLQCIPIASDQICFICFCFPKCEYPISYPPGLYQRKFVWNNVKYIGPTHTHDIQPFDTFFDNNEREYGQWWRYQIKTQKQLKKRMDRKWNKYKQRMKNVQMTNALLIIKLREHQRILRMKAMGQTQMTQLHQQQRAQINEQTKAMKQKQIQLDEQKQPQTKSDAEQRLNVISQTDMSVILQNPKFLHKMRMNHLSEMAYQG